VWTFDDYISDKAKILSQLSGAHNVGFLDLPVPKSTTTLSLSALEEIRRLPSDLPLLVKRQIISRIIMTTSGGEPFSPLTEADRAILNDRYHQNLEVIQKMGILI
jgi:hypothetical protein